jgi:uncharacterized protein with von Willebrand factor type A (vWA) domain
MTNGALPLLDLFYELRQRNFPLGTSEYVTVLNALVKGNVTTRTDLLFICQLVWAKSPEEQHQVAEAFASLLPKEFTESDLKALSEEMMQAESSASPPTAQFNSELSPGPAPLESKPPKSQLPDRPETSEQTTRADADSQFTFRLDHGTEQNLMAPVPKTTWHLNPRLDFVGSLPITKRQMKSAWRYNRRMRRVGAPVELDVAATVEEIYRKGVFLKPMLIPRRQNQARILILLDERGSMVPFRRVTQALLDSAKQSGFARASLFFFHDVPGKHLFHDPWLSTHEPAVRVLQSFIDAGVLVISDAGSARGNFEQSRVDQTNEFLQLVRRYTQNIAWLNPTPVERWNRTSAAAIRHECAVPMFELNRLGLDTAVNIMRGR